MNRPDLRTPAAGPKAPMNPFWRGFLAAYHQLRPLGRRAVLAVAPLVVVLLARLTFEEQIPALLGEVPAIALTAVGVAVWAARRELGSVKEEEHRMVWLGALAATPVIAVVAIGAAVLATVAVAVGAIVVVFMAVIWVISLFAGSDTKPVRRGANSHVNADGSAKKAFNTEREARAAAETYERDRGEKMNAYRCASCRSWHIGHARH